MTSQAVVNKEFQFLRETMSGPKQKIYKKNGWNTSNKVFDIIKDYGGHDKGLRANLKKLTG